MIAARYVYFTDDMKGMSAFYREVMGLKPMAPSKKIADDPRAFQQLASGSFEIALHRAAKPGGRGRNKLVFYVDDVAAARAALRAKGVKMGVLHQTEKLQLCDFKDPDGNVLQISNR